MAVSYPAPGGGPQQSGIGGLLAKLSTWANPFMGAINSIGSAISPIIGLFQTSPEGKAKISATASQQSLEQTGMQVQTAVLSGQMDPGQGLQILDQLIAMAASGSTASKEGLGQYDSRGMGMAYMSLVQMRGNIANKYNYQINQPAPDKSGSLVGISQNPETQKDWIKTQMRNRLMGFNQGTEMLEGSPIDRLFQKLNPTEGFAQGAEAAKSLVPDYQEPSKFDELRKRLEGGLNARKG